MDKVNYSEIKENFAKVIEKVCNEHQPIIITEDNHPAVVLISLADYSAYKENPNQPKFDPNVTPIWEIVAELGAKVPDEEWEKVPTDLSKNFDAYQTVEDEE